MNFVDLLYHIRYFRLTPPLQPSHRSHLSFNDTSLSPPTPTASALKNIGSTSLRLKLQKTKSRILSVLRRYFLLV